MMVIAIVVAVVTALSVVTRSAEQDLADKVDAYGANISVVPRSDELPLTYGGIHLGQLTYGTQTLRMEDLDKIRAIPDNKNLNRVAPKLLVAAEVGGVRFMAVGVQWGEELGLKTWWRLQGSRPDGPYDVLVGTRAAEKLGLAVGDTVEMNGSAFLVKALLESTGTQEDDLLYMNLSTAQRLWTREGELSFIEISAFCSSCPIEQISGEISAELPHARVSALRKAMESRELLIGQVRLFSVVLSAFMIAMGLLVVLTTTLSAVRERKREIGVFRALGYRRQHVLKIVLLENLALAALAAVIGSGLAAAFSRPLVRLVVHSEQLAPLGIAQLLALLGSSFGVVLVASLYPAIQAARLSPLLAMRRV
ncbi:MAG: hypothetical protein A2133_08365 [Actinobacteria bacterium RBG_16_64_13]|nr:MAG: hypothetical protein A2133_08365 [Actinobacteria bacterium RBG_16_64_13]